MFDIDTHPSPTITINSLELINIYFHKLLILLKTCFILNPFYLFVKISKLVIQNL